jgi:hypothetical protein
MSDCSICTKPHRGFHLYNKLVCLSCDELTFDIEIESDEEPRPMFERTTRAEGSPTIASVSTSLKK